MEAFIITFRESLEAAIIIGILISIVTTLKKRNFLSNIWMGVAAGVIGSIIFAWGFTVFFDGFSGKSEKIYEGVLMIGAAIMITHMVFWMKGQSGVFRKNIQEQVDRSISLHSWIPLFLIAFFSVIREGVETVIFFQAIDAQSNEGISFTGAILGVISAIILAIIIQRFSQKISYKKFFQYTGILLLFISAGLIAHGIVEFQGAGWIPTFIKPVFDLSPILSEKQGIGSFLKALFGYDANPSLLAIIGYIGFLSTSIFLWRKK